MNYANVISNEAKKDLELLRIEMQKSNPDCNIIFELISGSKYNRPIKK